MNLKQLTHRRLDEIITLINQIPSELYSEPQEILQKSTIGQHFRHIIEFYLCFMRGTERGIVCYDDRDRDLKVESDKQFAIERCEEFIQFLDGLEENAHLYLMADLSSGEGSRTKLNTSVERELAYVMDHGVHHLAVIKIALTGKGIDISSDIGVAAATIRHRKQCAQ